MWFVVVLVGTFVILALFMIVLKVVVELVHGIVTMWRRGAYCGLDIGPFMREMFE